MNKTGVGETSCGPVPAYCGSKRAPVQSIPANICLAARERRHVKHEAPNRDWNGIAGSHPDSDNSRTEQNQAALIPVLFITERSTKRTGVGRAWFWPVPVL